ncbi:MAG: nucleoside hydrolase [Microcoleaceae cyanobacterium]
MMLTQLTPPKIILDTDPGGDDALALLWLLSLETHGLAELVAITTVEGNVDARLTFNNACELLQLVNLTNITVGRGIVKPNPEIGDASFIHGVDGLGDLAATLPACHLQFEKAPASELVLIEKLNQFPGEITLICLAPLTNLAAAEKQSPGILKKAREIIIMGGAFTGAGNVTPQAEFNIVYDPDAAEVVFNSREDLVILPLDITRSLIFTPQMAEEIAQIMPKSAISQFLVSLCKSMTKTSLLFRETQGINGFLVHDAVTIAYRFYPETLQFIRGKVQVETAGKWTKGQTIIDRRHQAKIEANAWVGTQADAANLLAILVEDLKKLVKTYKPQ